MVNDVSASSGISSHEQVVNSISKQSFRWSYLLKCLLFPHFLFFFWFSNVILSDALILPLSVSASNTASDDVTN